MLLAPARATADRFVGVKSAVGFASGSLFRDLRSTARHAERQLGSRVDLAVDEGLRNCVVDVRLEAVGRVMVVRGSERLERGAECRPARLHQPLRVVDVDVRVVAVEAVYEEIRVVRGASDNNALGPVRDRSRRHDVRGLCNGRYWYTPMPLKSSAAKMKMRELTTAMSRLAGTPPRVAGPPEISVGCPVAGSIVATWSFRSDVAPTSR